MSREFGANGSGGCRSGRGPTGSVVRPLEAGRRVAGALELGLEPAAAWRTGTPMSTWWARCQPVLNGTIQNRGQKRLAHVMGGEAPVGRSAACPPCSATARRRLSTRHTVIHGNSQNTRVHPPVAEADARGRRTARPATRRIGSATCGPSVSRTAFSRPLRFFHPEFPKASRRILRHHESGGDRIAGVEAHVGLVRAELLLVVGHVAPAVSGERHEAG